MSWALLTSKVAIGWEAIVSMFWFICAGKRITQTQLLWRKWVVFRKRDDTIYVHGQQEFISTWPDSRGIWTSPWFTNHIRLCDLVTDASEVLGKLLNSLASQHIQIIQTMPRAVELIEGCHRARRMPAHLISSLKDARTKHLRGLKYSPASMKEGGVYGLYAFATVISLICFTVHAWCHLEIVAPALCRDVYVSAQDIFVWGKRGCWKIGSWRNVGNYKHRTWMARSISGIWRITDQSFSHIREILLYVYTKHRHILDLHLTAFVPHRRNQISTINSWV